MKIAPTRASPDGCAPTTYLLDPDFSYFALETTGTVEPVAATTLTAR